MSKTFIAAGDSYTVHSGHSEAPYSWVKYLAEERGYKEINVGRSSASNDYIFNSAIDAIESNKNEDLIVVAMWTDPIRQGLFDTADLILSSEENLMRLHEKHDLNNAELNAYYRDYVEIVSSLSELIVEFMRNHNFIKNLTMIDVFSNIFNSTLRKMYLLEEYCKIKNIEFYHGSSLNFDSSHEIISILSRQFEKENIISNSDVVTTDKTLDDVFKTNKYYQMLDSSDRFMGFDFDSWTHVHDNDAIISGHNHHPNTKGHKLLAGVISKFIDDGIRIKLPRKMNNPIYIYD